MTNENVYKPLRPRTVRELSVRGARYAVNEWGDADAPLIVYLHGWGDTGSTLQFVIDLLESDWHVVAPDWRGFGRSEIECTSYWFPDYLADLNELLSIYSPGEPVRLAGHSMGANVAALYAGAMPERVAALVNIEGFGLPDSDPDDAPRRYREWIESRELAFSEYTGYEALAARIRKRNPHMSAAAAGYVAREWAERGSDGIVRLRADPLHKLPNPVLYRRAEAEACWRAITASSLLVVGAESRLAERLPQGISLPGAKRIVIDEAGHMLHFEAPEALAAVIENFLQPTL